MGLESLLPDMGSPIPPVSEPSGDPISTSGGSLVLGVTRSGPYSRRRNSEHALTNERKTSHLGIFFHILVI